jgi:hypothetical protein
MQLQVPGTRRWVRLDSAYLSCDFWRVADEADSGLDRRPPYNTRPAATGYSLCCTFPVVSAKTERSVTSNIDHVVGVDLPGDLLEGLRPMSYSQNK